MVLFEKQSKSAVINGANTDLEPASGGRNSSVGLRRFCAWPVATLPPAAMHSRVNLSPAKSKYLGDDEQVFRVWGRLFNPALVRTQIFGRGCSKQ